MNEERWAQVSEMLRDQFEILEHTNEPLDPGPGEEEIYVFDGPQGRMKLVRTTRPKVLEKKVLSSRRIGGEVSEEFVYSEDEQTHTLKAFVWNDTRDDWMPIDVERSFNV